MASLRLSALLTTTLALGFAAAAASQDVEHGRDLYVDHCAVCHGESGRGDGPRSRTLGVAPRDFTLGAFKCRSTPTGSAPTDDDLLRVINGGLRGTPMTGFERKLGTGDAEAIVAYLTTLSPALADRGELVVLSIPEAPAVEPETVLDGRAIYGLLRCWNCHGTDGRGKGPAAAGLEDDWGRSIRVYDFTRGRRFKCGSEDADLYRLLHTGLTGSPMPSYTEAFAFAADGVGDLSSLELALGAEAVAATAAWLAGQPSAADLGLLDGVARQRLIDRRTWSLIAYLRSLSGR